MAGMFEFIKGSREELRKVVWPGRDEVLGSTVVVMVAVIVISIFLYSTDMMFESLFDFVIGMGTGR